MRERERGLLAPSLTCISGFKFAGFYYSAEIAKHPRRSMVAGFSHFADMMADRSESAEVDDSPAPVYVLSAPQSHVVTLEIFYPVRAPALEDPDDSPRKSPGHLRVSTTMGMLSS